MGLVPEKKPLQIDCMDSELRIDLHNNIKLFEEYIHKKHFQDRGSAFSDMLFILYRRIWVELFCFDMDRITLYNFGTLVKNQYLSLRWNSVYDFLEFYVEIFVMYSQEIIYRINQTLEKHNSGYRLLDNKIIAITYESELQEVSEASKTPYNAVNQHLKKAIEIFSNRETKDYRNTIKEAISAVEAMCNVINGTETETLGQMLKSLHDKIQIHNCLKETLDSIWGFACATSRHGTNEKTKYEPDFADAKFMLVSCSAFINYLILKSNVT